VSVPRRSSVLKVQRNVASALASPSLSTWMLYDASVANG
jgi:hypothetical protein